MNNQKHNESNFMYECTCRQGCCGRTRRRARGGRCCADDHTQTLLLSLCGRPAAGRTESRPETCLCENEGKPAMTKVLEVAFTFASSSGQTNDKQKLGGAHEATLTHTQGYNLYLNQHTQTETSCAHTKLTRTHGRSRTHALNTPGDSVK